MPAGGEYPAHAIRHGDDDGPGNSIIRRKDLDHRTVVGKPHGYRRLAVPVGQLSSGGATGRRLHSRRIVLARWAAGEPPPEGATAILENYTPDRQAADSEALALVRDAWF